MGLGPGRPSEPFVTQTGWRDRRRWHGPPALLAVLTAELLALLLAGAWQWNSNQTTLQRQAERIAQRMDAVISEADRELSLIAQRHDLSCSDAAIAALQRLAFTRDYIREAGVVVGDRLHCTSWGVNASPFQVAPEHRTRMLRDTRVSVLVGSGLDIDETVVSLLYAHIVGQSDHLNVLLDPGTIFAPFMQHNMVGATYRIVVNGQPVLTYHEHAPMRGRMHSHGADRELREAFALIRVNAPTDTAGVAVQASESRTSFLRALPLRQWPLLIGLPVTVLIVVVLMHRRQAARYSPEDEIRHGLAHDTFRFHFQPLVDLRSGQCVGCEALMRWHNPQRGILEPGIFLPLATSAGLLAAMTLQAVRAMVRDLGDVMRRHPRMRVSINIDTRDLLDARLLEDIEAVLREAGIKPRQVVFEITEVSQIEDPDGSAALAVQRIRERGFGIAIDDFGTGYCSFDYLRRYSVDYLKIDRSFIAGLQEPELGQPLLATIVQLGHQLDLRLVAEGIETIEQRDHLRRLGVHNGQGYHYGRAMPAGAFAAFLDHERRTAA